MPFDTMKRLCRKEDVLIEEIKGKEFLINKTISFGNVNVAAKINRYMWFIDPKIVAGLLIIEMQKFPSIPVWIRKDKKKDDDIDKLIVDYVRRFELDPKMLTLCYPQVRVVVDANLKQFFKEMDAPEKLYKKYKIDLVIPEPQSELDQWF